jgi:hypothetical protein
MDEFFLGVENVAPQKRRLIKLDLFFKKGALELIKI